ncbi:MAG: methylenetetrahydrofolate reductase [NAD(P)H] [Bacteroidetes bacterium CG2_30_33_31]|nr:MAG: methylenetetrahydrofolate reductase [NAD(P)H] [Bacteroidetes bacterium CG2_30_33_31]
MKVIDHIRQSKGTLFSFEILPPLKGEHFEQILQNIQDLLEFEPAFIDVTYHQQEVEYRDLPNGNIEKRTVRKRPGTVGISAAVLFKTGIDVVPHLICGGFSQEETENALIDLHFLGINNIMLLRGDPPSTVKYFKPEPDGHKNALGLVKQVNNLNNAIYLEKELQNTHSTDFCIGVAGYPEKHSEAPNKQLDIKYLKQKVDAGAEYIVTQMFFDNKKYFDFVNDCREVGIKVPIIPGLKPLVSINQLMNLPQTFHIDMPEALVNEAIKCKDNISVRQLGIEWAIAQAKELKKSGAPVIHFYTMGKSDNIMKIAKEVF